MSVLRNERFLKGLDLLERRNVEWLDHAILQRDAQQIARAAHLIKQACRRTTPGLAFALMEAAEALMRLADGEEAEKKLLPMALTAADTVLLHAPRRAPRLRLKAGGFILNRFDRILALKGPGFAARLARDVALHAPDARDEAGQPSETLWEAAVKRIENAGLRNMEASLAYHQALEAGNFSFSGLIEDFVGHRLWLLAGEEATYALGGRKTERAAQTSPAQMPQAPAPAY
jgi:hypothetical protein